ncbi:hypothetical protein C7417_3880 [Cupriavidus plantarum]|nr:hypothetical protein C7417_3880 [Cupriavidus plantarum]
MTAYRWIDGKVVPVLPKEWDAIDVQMRGLAADLRARFPNQNDDEIARQGAYAAWRQEAPSVLPAGTFVWRDEFAECFRSDFSKSSLTIINDKGEADERHGDRELIYAPLLSPRELNLVWDSFQAREGATNNQFSPEVRKRFVSADFWHEKELLALCLGVSAYSDRDDIAPREVRETTRQLIWAALQSGELPAEINPAAGAAERLYGGVWRIPPARAVRWALSRFPQFPEWLSSSKLKEVYEIQEAEKKAEGRYTLREAAEAIAASGERLEPLLEKLMTAAKMGAFPMYGPGEKATYRYYSDTQVRPFHEEAYWRDLNNWILSNEPRISFRFPAPTTVMAIDTADDGVKKPYINTQQPNRPKIHRTAARRHALTAVLEDAKNTAKDASDYHSVWAELVRKADSEGRPAPLLGYVEGEGVKYQTDNGVKFLTKDALRKRMIPGAR